MSGDGADDTPETEAGERADRTEERTTGDSSTEQNDSRTTDDGRVTDERPVTDTGPDERTTDSSDDTAQERNDDPETTDQPGDGTTPPENETEQSDDLEETADSAWAQERSPSRDGRDSESAATDRPNGDASGAPERIVAERADAPADSSAPPRPRPEREKPDVTIEDDGVIRWFLKTNDGTVVAVRDILSSVALVAVIGLILFGVSGIWPPLVAVESGSMEPNMEIGDMIFVVAPDRFVGDDPTGDTGVVTLENGEESGHDKFGKPGDVIIFLPNGQNHQTPVIHRAHFWVEEGENWVDEQANPDYVNGASCAEIYTCPAPHAGFITKGDANSGYDQVTRSVGADTSVVKPEWTTGKGMFRIPWLGHVRLLFERIIPTMLGLGSSSLLTPNPLLAGFLGAVSFAGVHQWHARP
ncbi:S26 family signal peptidase [Natrialbaceae archaeon A-chndr2]